MQAALMGLVPDPSPAAVRGARLTVKAPRDSRSARPLAGGPALPLPKKKKKKKKAATGGQQKNGQKRKKKKRKPRAEKAETAEKGGEKQDAGVQIASVLVFGKKSGDAPGGKVSAMDRWRKARLSTTVVSAAKSAASERSLRKNAKQINKVARSGRWDVQQAYRELYFDVEDDEAQQEFVRRHAPSRKGLLSADCTWSSAYPVRGSVLLVATRNTAGRVGSQPLGSRSRKEEQRIGMDLCLCMRRPASIDRSPAAGAAAVGRIGVGGSSGTPTSCVSSEMRPTTH